MIKEKISEDLIEDFENEMGDYNPLEKAMQTDMKIENSSNIVPTQLRMNLNNGFSPSSGQIRPKSPDRDDVKSPIKTLKERREEWKMPKPKFIKISPIQMKKELLHRLINKDRVCKLGSKSPKIIQKRKTKTEQDEIMKRLSTKRKDNMLICNKRKEESVKELPLCEKYRYFSPQVERTCIKAQLRWMSPEPEKIVRKIGKFRGYRTKISDIPLFPFDQNKREISPHSSRKLKMQPVHLYMHSAHNRDMINVNDSNLEFLADYSNYKRKDSLSPSRRQNIKNTTNFYHNSKINFFQDYSNLNRNNLPERYPHSARKQNVQRTNQIFYDSHI